MKRTALKRKTPLRRKSKPTKRAPRRVGKRGPARDKKYLEFVRILPCAVRESLPPVVTFYGAPSHLCYGWNHAHHAGPRPGVGMKCSDYETHCFCAAHHEDWHRGRGQFKGWTRKQRREWADARIAETQRALGYVGDPTRAGTSKEGE